MRASTDREDRHNYTVDNVCFLLSKCWSLLCWSDGDAMIILVEQRSRLKSAGINSNNSVLEMSACGTRTRRDVRMGDEITFYDAATPNSGCQYLSIYCVIA